MKLLIDIGNTRIKWAALRGSNLEPTGAVEHRSGAANSIAAMLDQITVPPVSVRAANVAGAELGALLVAAIDARWHLPVEFAESQACAGRVRNAYSDHGKLGVDRWLAILAGVASHPEALCIVDAGTAVTVDLVAAGGAHLGGFIVPGIDLMRRALISDTGNIERFADAGGNRPAGSVEPGRNTSAAIKHGALAMHCAFIDRCVLNLTADNGATVLLMTGGDAPRIMAHLDLDAEHRPQLVLEGLALYEPGT